MRAYDEQLHRMECLGHEIVSFDDIYTQMCDLVGLRPLVTGGTFDEFTMQDFTRHGPDHMMLCGNFFNMLFNLNKFVAFEQRDPFLLKQQVRFGCLSSSLGKIFRRTVCPLTLISTRSPFHNTIDSAPRMVSR